MTIEKRKQIVIRLLSIAHEKANLEAEVIRNEQNPTLEFIHEHLRKFILAKFLLTEECEELQIRKLAELSVAKTMNFDKNLIKQADKPAPCDNVSSSSAKKIMLLFAIRKEMKINPKAADLISKKTIIELAELVHSMRTNMS